jgi:hypothetical protein
LNIIDNKAIANNPTRETRLTGVFNAKSDDRDYHHFHHQHEEAVTLN